MNQATVHMTAQRQPNRYSSKNHDYIKNLIAAAGQTVVILEKQIGAYSDYESEENLWQDFIQKTSDEIQDEITALN